METKTVTNRHAEVFDYLFDAANHHTLMMQGMTDIEAGNYLKGVIEENDVVFAMWPDGEHPTGVGVKLIKDGAGLYQGKPDARVPLSAIMCPDEEHADQLIGLLELYGTGTSIN